MVRDAFIEAIRHKLSPKALADKSATSETSDARKCLKTGATRRDRTGDLLITKFRVAP